MMQSWAQSATKMTSGTRLASDTDNIPFGSADDRDPIEMPFWGHNDDNFAA